MSKSQKGFIPLWIVLGILIIILIALFPSLNSRFNYLSQFNNKNQASPSPASRNGRFGQPILHPDPVAMKVIDLNFNWTDSRVAKKDGNGFDQSYGNAEIKVKKAYLTPFTVYNFFPNNVSAGLKAKSFLIIETNVRDLRTNGNPRDIKGDQYFRIRRNGEDQSPLDGFETFKPQENKNVNVVFTADENETSFTLIAGPLPNPRVETIDFGGSAAKRVVGVYDWPLGFFDKLQTP